jgi:D-alanyl-D-alanine carboxypeptidase/D-alanyl-D-alanine-endopeptidase (penicillin-binding protein 4)
MFVTAVAYGASGVGVAHAEGPAAIGAAAAGRAPEIEAAVAALVGDRAFKDAKVSIAIVDVDSGRLLASHDEHLPLNPASNAKVYTAAAALATLRGEHRFETTISGHLEGGEVAGPLVLRGSGDPSLATSDLTRMVEELRGLGLRHVTGDILVDQRAFDEQTVPPAFEQQPNEWASFRAPVSAVALNENTVTMTVRPTREGAPALVTFDPPGFVDVEGAVTTHGEGADGVGLVLAGAGQRLSAKVSGTVGSDARVVRFTRRADDPTLLAGYALKAELERAQIKVDGGVKSGGAKGAILARHLSEPLSSLLYSVGKNSDNFYAEMIFKSLGGEAKRRPARHADAAEVVTEWAKKAGAFDAGTIIKNGSGLFDANRLTSFGITSVLRAAWKDPAMATEFVAQLAVGGSDGTLRKRFRDGRARRIVRAKTGTLESAIALSGYVLGPSGKPPIAFSILMNGTAGKAAQARAAMDTLVEMLVRRQWAASP